MKHFYPDFIRALPEADISFKGLKGWISQAEDHQVIFFEIEPVGKVAEHKHGAQWGVVFEGEMDMTIGGKTKTYKNGDSYFIPSGVLHSAAFRKKTCVMDVFADRERYKPKKK
jgi:quercetin dioxygenase-like cupin family protein